MFYVFDILIDNLMNKSFSGVLSTLESQIIPSNSYVTQGAGILPKVSVDINGPQVPGEFSLLKYVIISGRK